MNMTKCSFFKNNSISFTDLTLQWCAGSLYENKSACLPPPTLPTAVVDLIDPLLFSYFKSHLTVLISEKAAER